MSRFSPDRVNSLAAQIAAELNKEPGVKYLQPEMMVKMGIGRALRTELATDDKHTAAAKQKIAKMKNGPAEGTVQYNALLDQFYREELATLRKIR